MIIRILCAAALAATYPSSAHAHNDGKSEVTLVYDHALPNVPGKSKGVLVQYAPGGTSPATPTRHPPSSTRRSYRERSALGQRRAGRDLSRRRKLLGKSRRSPL
jgi:hypothetical protein